MQPEGSGNDDVRPNSDEVRSGRRHTRKSATVRRYRKFTRYVIIPGLLLLVLGVSAFFLRRPVMNRVRAWKSDKVLAAAEVEYRAGRYLEVNRKLQVALQLAPLHPRVQRLAARFYTEVGVPEALNHWQLVITAPDASIEDRLAYVDACIKFLRADLASAELNSLELTISKSPAFLRRVVRYLVLVEDFNGAVPYAREAQVADPRDEELELLLGTCLVRSKVQPQFLEGRRLLLGLAVASGSQQLAAARELIATGTLSMVEARQIARALERRTDLKFADRLEISGLRMPNDGAERERVARSLAEELPPKDDDERLAYGAWVLRMQLPGVARAFLQPLTTTNVDLLTLKAEALATSGAWGDLEKMIQEDGKLLPPGTLAGVQAYRAVARGENDQAVAVLSSAIDSISSSVAKDSVRQLTVLSNWAERAQQTNLAIRALVPLLPVRSVLPIAARRMLVLSAGSDSLSLVMPALRALRGYAPNDLSVQLAFCHVSLVLNENLDDAVQLAEALYSASPESDMNRILVAFARYRQAKPLEAIEILDQKPIDPTRLDPRLRALIAVSRHAAGQREVARQLTREIPRGALKSEELKLVESVQ